MYSTLAAHVPLVLCVIICGAVGDNRSMVVHDLTTNEDIDAETIALREQLLREVGDALGIINPLSELGSGMSDIERVLRPIIVASAKNEYGRLDDAASRYALHRYFMQQHAWDMRTFISSDKADSELTCLFDFGRPVPFAVQEALEKRVGDRGASIVELSVFVVLLEHLVRDEVPRMVEAAYQVMGHPRTAQLSLPDATDLIAFQMATQINSEDASRYTRAKAISLLEQMPNGYGGWGFAQQVLRSAQRVEAPNATQISFSDVVRIVTRLQKNLTHVQNFQCQGLKENLLDIEVPGSGRVRLPDFYDSALSKGNLEFMESIDYLRQLGAVDERRAGDPQVVIANYLDGPSNCIAASGYYSVCCLDECVDLYMQLEDALKKPAATPEEILSVIKVLSTPSTPEALLSNSQIKKLHETAQNHVGLIELHGQDFAQWMHRAFPRECADPSLSGPAHFMTLQEWAATSGLNVVEAVSDARRIVEQAQSTAKHYPAESFGEIWEEEEAVPPREYVLHMNGTLPKSVTAPTAEGKIGESPTNSPKQDHQSITQASSWVSKVRWGALVLVVLLVPVRSVWSVYVQHTQHIVKAPKIAARGLEAEMSDLQASILVESV